MEKVQALSIAISLAILFGVFELVRNGRLRESYSVLWIATSLIIIFFAVFRRLVDWVGQLFGVYYSPSAVFLLAFLFLILITVQFSVIISSLADKNKNLAQEIAILKMKVSELEKRS